MRILVIEDSLSYRDLVLKVCRDIGLETDAVSSAADGLYKLEQDSYDLICVDLHFPEMDGLEICRRVRKLEHSKMVPVILLTSDQGDYLQQNAFEAGITEVLQKTEADPLRDALSNFIDRIERKISGHILYVEDSRSVATLTRSYLQDAGLTVEHYSSADQALSTFLEQDFDLVISDIVVEGRLSGIGLLRSIRALDDHRSELPFLAVSGTLGEQRKVAILRQGADDFIAKPIVKEEMLARIANLIAKNSCLTRFWRNRTHCTKWRSPIR